MNRLPEDGGDSDPCHGIETGHITPDAEQGGAIDAKKRKSTLDLAKKEIETRAPNARPQEQRPRQFR